MKRALLLCILAGAWFCGCSDDGSDNTNIGGSCESNDECESGLCDKNVCRSRDGSGGSIINGEACTSNAQCVSNNCYEGKVCRAPNWKGNTKRQVGDTCAESNDCMSNNCVSGVCNPTGVKDTKIANGLACTKNEQCATSNCYNGKVCRATTWSDPSGKADNGEACTSNKQCASNYCDENHICRAANSGSADKLDIGDACTKNEQCESNYCYNNTVCKNPGNNSGVISTSNANVQYCDALITECGLEVYRNYSGCIETMDLLRDIAPDCQKEWDDTYKCISTQTCDEIAKYTDPISGIGYSSTPSYWVPSMCAALAKKYKECMY